MTTPVWSLAEEHKFGRIFFYHLSPFSSFRTTKIRQNFFVPSAHSIILDTSVSSLHGSTRLTYPYPHRSRLSFLFSPIDHLRLNPSSKFLSIRSCALRILYVFLYSSFHLVFLLRHSVHDSITLRSWPSWVCRVSNAHGGCDVYPTLASILFCFGCATYPMLVVGVTCTFSSRSFQYLVRPVTSRRSSMFRSPSLSCFCKSLSPVILSYQSTTVPLCPCLRFCQCLHGIAIVIPLFHYRIPAVIRSPDLWLPFGFSVFLSLSSPSPLFVLFSQLHPLSRRNLVFSQHHRLFLSQHFFLRSRYPVSLQPNLHLRS